MTLSKHYPVRLSGYLLLLITSIVFAGCSLPFGKPNFAGLQINADPQSAVYIDGKHVGESNYYDNKLKPAEHTVKLTPLSGSTESWETKVKLLSGLTTIINRSFGVTPQESSFYTLQLEKITNKKIAELSIITTPENVIVRLDDQPKGFSPLNNVGINLESHKVTLSAPGYKTQAITIDPIAGYRITLYAELGKALALQAASPSATPSASLSPEPSPSPTPTLKPGASAKPSPTPIPSVTPKPTATPKASPVATPVIEPPYVEILTTPTGWLRVRSEPNGLTENEVGKVDSGTKHAFIESNNTGWYKIEYELGKEGWVAAQYTRLVK